MNRRNFLATSLAVAGAAAGAATPSKLRAASLDGKKFKMKYAPHFGMFRHNAGKNPLDQLKFAADQGFTAWEDNGMMKKPVDLQEKIGKTMVKLGSKKQDGKIF